MKRFCSAESPGASAHGACYFCFSLHVLALGRWVDLSLQGLVLSVSLLGGVFLNLLGSTCMQDLISRMTPHGSVCLVRFPTTMVWFSRMLELLSREDLPRFNWTYIYRAWLTDWFIHKSVCERTHSLVLAVARLLTRVQIPVIILYHTWSVIFISQMPSF